MNKKAIWYLDIFWIVLIIIIVTSITFNIGMNRVMKNSLQRNSQYREMMYKQMYYEQRELDRQYDEIFQQDLETEMMMYEKYYGDGNGG